MSIPFRFESVLRVREVERDRCQVKLAMEQQRIGALQEDHDRLTVKRLAVLDERRSLQIQGDWQAEVILALTDLAERLAAELDVIQQQLTAAIVVRTRYHSELLQAETAVKAIETLREKHLTQQRIRAEKIFEQEREEGWRAAS
jgi:hypothetical protein